MRRGYQPKILIVEGKQDQRVVPEFIEAKGIPWGENKEKAIVYIDSYGSDQFTDRNEISTELKATGLTHLGLMVDADYNPSGRWQSIRNACLESIPDFPKQLP